MQNKRLRLLLVSQAQSRRFYSDALESEGIAGILRHTKAGAGPLALFTRFDADVAIVEDAVKGECRVWEEGIMMGDRAKERIAEVYASIGDVANRVETCRLADISWSQYDIVVSIYISVPSRIVRAHPNILWCYYLIDPSPLFLVSKFLSPMFRYHVFLNQNLAVNPLPDPVISRFRKYRRAAIDFPFTLLERNMIRDDLGNGTHEGIQIEPRSRRYLDEAKTAALKAYGTVSRARIASLAGYLREMSRRKYFVVLQDHPTHFRGNALIEASAAGCLILAPYDFKCMYRNVVDEECRYDGFSGLLAMLEAFEREPQRYADALQRQQDVAEEQACTNPLQGLLVLHEILRSDAFARGSKHRAAIVDGCLYGVYLLVFHLLLPLYVLVNRACRRWLNVLLPELVAKTINRKGKLF